MLQQTRVDVVCDYYERWLRTFPTLESLARTPYPRVLKQWEGLGYYSRARNLHRAAKIVVGRARPPGATGAGGRRRMARRSVPTSFEELSYLPGIGRYTAGAIASIAFGERVPVVDGNVTRVLARMFCIRDDVTKPATQKLLWALADALVPARRPGDFNQALMELGALVCTPVRPHCETCPLRSTCRAFAQGAVEELPNRGGRKRVRRVTADVALVRRGARVLLHRRGAHGLLAGMWELPVADARRFHAGAMLFAVRHTITNRRITMQVVSCRLRRRVNSNVEWRWVSRRDLKRLTLPSAQRRALSRIFLMD